MRKYIREFVCVRINELHTRNQSKIMEVDCLTDHMSSLSTNQGIFVPLDGQDYIDQKPKNYIKQNQTQNENFVSVRER